MDRLRVAYARVSTRKGEQLSALQLQLSWLQQQACDLVLSDIESGYDVTADRPDYDRLRQLIEDGRVAEVVATRLDRLGRNAAESDAFVALCDSKQTAVTTRDDGRLTMATPEDLLLTRLKASLAQGESMKISQRVKAARQEGEAQRRPMRRPCFGYRLSKDRMRMELDPAEAPIARRLIATVKQHGWRIATAMTAFEEPIPIKTPCGLRHWLLNPVIRGALAYQQRDRNKPTRILWDQHEPLLSHEDYAVMQVVMSKNRQLWGRHSQKVPRALTSLCVCAACGHRMKYASKSFSRTVTALYCGWFGCEVRYKPVPEERILDFVVIDLARQAAERLALLAHSAEPPEVALLRRQIEALKAQDDPDLEDALERKRQRLAALISAPQVNAELVRKIADPAWFDSLSYDELTLILHQVVERILISRLEPAEVALKP